MEIICLKIFRAADYTFHYYQFDTKYTHSLICLFI